jgi:hypothetical protein
MLHARLRERSLRLAREDSSFLFELAPQIYLAFLATDRSHRSSDSTKQEGEVGRIANGSDAGQLARGACGFCPTGMRGLPRRTSHDSNLQISSSPASRVRRGFRLRSRMDQRSAHSGKRVFLLVAKQHSFLLRNCERDSATLARQERNT